MPEPTDYVDVKTYLEYDGTNGQQVADWLGAALVSEEDGVLTTHTTGDDNDRVTNTGDLVTPGWPLVPGRFANLSDLQNEPS